MSVHPVCQICWIWLMVWVMNVAMVCRIGWHAVLIWFQIPVNHVAKLFQSRCPFRLGEEPCQCGHDRADGHDKHADRIRIQAALNASCTAVAALVTALHAD